MATATDSQLGRHLMTERGMQWLHAHGGDPYAVVLRAEDEDNGALAGRIRELGPLYRSRTGAWVTADHALAAQILHDPRLGSRLLAENLPEGHVLRECDPFPAGGPVPISSSAAVDRAVGEVVGRIAAEFDLVRDVVRPVLVELVAEQFAVPSGQRENFGLLCGAAAIALDAVLCPPKLTHARAMITACGSLRASYVGNDGMLASVLGVEVTANAVANAVLALLERRDRWRELCADPSSAGDALEETLRSDPSIRLDSRIAHEDVELAGVAISAGSEVVVHVEAAGHLPLTGGPHLDAVAPLVRSTAAAVLGAVATRFPRLRPTGAVVRRLRAPVTRAIVRFPVTA